MGRAAGDGDCPSPGGTGGVSMARRGSEDRRERRAVGVFAVHSNR